MSGLADIGLTDGVGIDDIFWFVCGLAATMTALGVISRPFVSRVRRYLDWQDKFQRDWEGEEGGPGRSRIPGVMERLNAIDGELKRNGGSSLKDQVCETRGKIDSLVSQVTLIESRQRDIQSQLEEHVRSPGGYDSGKELI